MCDEAFGDAETIQNFKRALRPANAARSFADAIGVVDEHDRHAAQREIDGGRKSHRPGANHHDRTAHNRARILIGRTTIIVTINRFAAVWSSSRAFGYPRKAAHMARSRSAVQN